MEEVRTTEDLMEQLSNMNRENSVRQVFIPGKGKFTIVLQEEDHNSIAADIQSNPDLGQMMNESMEAYIEGRTKSTSELLKALSVKDFSKCPHTFEQNHP
ncbi:hypothetical protein Back11_37640 [Paenibacillus baekrokdamisoli]|uniref:Uncharacterized protein n=1 Tax=Paenibacillus baekrokdamisoli TaxID=1712516 RepID=A0A3G9JHD2_9BACL|nr:hypothetical protein [Paenibacillus baekrokdamisoli]MBB3068541.1 hypothetical protein [Paenibacillus baekrokdamisoli]BBH22419.1 hypothetical protein Back11_37640 [Paenibacillus baekrokdamisoli]